MAERHVVVDQLRLNYEGLIDFAALYTLINSWTFDMGYDRYEKLNEQTNTPEGKHLNIDLRPWKRISLYLTSHIRVRLFATLKDVETEIKGEKKTLQQGKVQIIIDGFFDTDWMGIWHNKAFLYFLRALFDRYLFKNYTERSYSLILSDVNDLHTKVKNFLNIYRYGGEFKGRWE